MTVSLFVFSGISLAGILTLAWLLFTPRHAAGSGAGAVANSAIEDLLPQHCRHFPQMCRVLRADDLSFVRRRAPWRLARSWRAERHRLLRRYLEGLVEDFLRLERLARVLATLSPRVNRRQEWGLFLQGIKFRLLYRLVVLHLLFGSITVPELERLTELVSGLAAALEQEMSGIGTSLAPPLRADFGG